MATLHRSPATLVAALLALGATQVHARTSDCLFNDGFDDVVNPCASVAGCPVPVPSPSASQQIANARQAPDGVLTDPCMLAMSEASKTSFESLVTGIMDPA